MHHLLEFLNYHSPRLLKVRPHRCTNIVSGQHNARTIRIESRHTHSLISKQPGYMQYTVQHYCTKQAISIYIAPIIIATRKCTECSKLDVLFSFLIYDASMLH